MNDIRLALVTILNADSRVTAWTEGGRIHPSVLPQNQRAPSLVYHRLTDTSDYHMQGDSGLAQTFMQIDAWAQHADVAGYLADAVHDALSGFRGIVVTEPTASPPGTIDIKGIFHINGRDLFDETVQLHRMSRDYRIAYAER